EALVVEFEEVRPRSRRLLRDDVHDEHRAVRVLPAAEGIDVGDVRRGIEGDQRRFPMAARSDGPGDDQDLEQNREPGYGVDGDAAPDTFHAVPPGVRCEGLPRRPYGPELRAGSLTGREPWVASARGASPDLRARGDARISRRRPRRPSVPRRRAPVVRACPKASASATPLAWARP